MRLSAAKARTGKPSSFSPVAGIQWVETFRRHRIQLTFRTVSVPLPGFSGLRPSNRGKSKPMATGFSPVAGIQWVETPLATPGKWVSNSSCFSPVAGIQWVETFCFPHRFGSEWGVSVPLPGFSGLRHTRYGKRSPRNLQFQSRCRDSVG